MLTLDEFRATYEGQSNVGAGCGGFPPGECTSLACLWCDNLGLTTPCGSCGNCSGGGYHCDGACWQGSGYSGWTWIPNGPSNFPSPGDLVCFRGGCHNIGCHGHVDLCLSATPGSIISLANNWGCNLCCQVVTHTDYACVVGWQHPNVTATPAPPAPAPAPPLPTCSPACDSCSACQGGRCVSSCPAGWSCSGGLCAPPPSPPAAAPAPAPLNPAVPVVAALVLAALTGVAAWQATRHRPGPGLGGGASTRAARRPQAAPGPPLTPSATAAAGHGFGSGG
jgi:hypothetical protein